MSINQIFPWINNTKYFISCGEIRRWSHEHPTVAKILGIAGLILGVSLLTYKKLSRVPYFQDVNSSTLQTLSLNQTVLSRKDFLELDMKFPPPLITRSEFVSTHMVEHLMRNKTNMACGVKYQSGGSITEMEGILHTFVTPLCLVLMIADFRYKGRSKVKLFGNNQVRKVILSASIQPDFECAPNPIMMKLVGVKEEAVIGEPLHRMTKDSIPSADEKKNYEFRKNYDEKLLKHLIYHLTPTHRLPADAEIDQSQIMDKTTTETYIANLIRNPKEGQNLQGKFMRIENKHIGNKIISLEILFQVYVHLIRNEFKTLNPNTPQGYVYTINPPSIFATGIGDARILNRLQALAFQSLVQEKLFSNLKYIAFDDYADKDMIPLLQEIFPNIEVSNLDSLFNEDGMYKGLQGYALVLHNNSDAFGQNIEYELATSLDGVIGMYSNAACILRRQWKDLLKFVF